MRLPVILLLLASGAAHAQQSPPPSLFFSADEVATIERLLKVREVVTKAVSAVPAEEPRPPAPDVYLGALFYAGPNEWAVWVNGAKRTTRQRIDDIEVVRVTPEGADLVWRGDPKGGPRRIQLRPYQTWIGATGEVLEGVIAAPAAAPPPKGAK